MFGMNLRVNMENIHIIINNRQKYSVRQCGRHQTDYRPLREIVR
jgi:hypothetical protein